MQLDLKKLPFGQTMSRHLLFEEWDPKGRGYEKGYWLALANESSNLFGFGGVERSAGQILLQPTANGAPVEAALSATHALAELKAEAGSIRFAIDGAALLLEGDGLGLHMRVKVNPGEVASRTADGCILILGATRYIIEMKKGSCKVETRWNLDNLCSYDPELTLTPEDGRLEAVFWDCDTTCRKPAAVSTVAEAAARAEQSFAEFRSHLRGTSELYAYVLWQSLMILQGQTFVVNNKAGDIQAPALHQSLAALAFSDAAGSIGLLLSQLRCMTARGLVPSQVRAGSLTFEAAVPMWGAVLLRAPDWSDVPAGTLEELDSLLRWAVAWWEAERQTRNGAFFYAYSHECGWPYPALLPDNEPVISPDLAGWMAANYTALAKLSKALGKPDAAEFQEKADGQLSRLRAMQTDGACVCFGVLTGKSAPCPEALCQLTALSGEPLPNTSAEPPAASGLLQAVLALQDRQTAETLLRAGAERPVAAAASFYDPTLCALLLALEERR